MTTDPLDSCCLCGQAGGECSSVVLWVIKIVNILSKISPERLLSESLREPLPGDGKHESVDADGEEHDEGDDDKHE